jgi:hypothetical protein
MSSNNLLTSRPAMFVYGAVAIIVAVFVGAIYVAPLMDRESEFAAYNMDDGKVAIHGYDTVAYFTEGKAMKGTAEFEHAWEDARWRFASATNRELFKANPERYAPQFGGYCAGGLAAGEYANGNPESWTIVDGKLYFNKNHDLRTVWREAPDTLIKYAEYNWDNFRGDLRDNR